MTTYEHKKIEEKYNKPWYDNNIYKAEDFSQKPKKYILAEFPYPSGKALHAGHMMRYTVPDVYSRYLRLSGYNVLFPMGWDAFGLPAENFAVKTGIHPAITTMEAIDAYRESFKKMGYGIDWDREVNTTDPKYYKWTQWLFLKFWEAGLAEYKELPVWWCEELKTVLAEEEVLTDKEGNKISERLGYKVTRKLLKQWSLKITKYADKLLSGLNTVDFPDAIKTAQTNWIGRSEGAIINFPTGGTSLKVFTTRPDTLFGVTFLAISPEHPAISELIKSAKNPDEIKKYLDSVKNKSDLEKRANKNKTGIKIEGVTAVHPFSEVSERIPVYIADYVLMDYGTGAIMGVPAHDERDKDFAQKQNINIVEVIDKNGVMINSGKYNGELSEKFINTAIYRLTDEEKGYKEITYKLRDWLFSRQRYWGEPIPLVHTKNGIIEALVKTTDAQEVKEKLPLLLPEVPDYSPTSDGNSPLSKNKSWVATKDSQGHPAERETNTMPNWAGSCWYYLRYIDPKNDTEFAAPDKMKYWLPVDRYFGGAEHTTMHLLYSRFWHQFFYDQGLVPTAEPYQWRMNGGMLLGPDGRKMSKSLGNIINPMEMVETYGADALRLYICFIGPYEDTYPWNPAGIKATYKFVKTVYELQDIAADSEPQEVSDAFNTMLINISSMLENLKMNTCVSEFMKFINVVKDKKAISKDTLKKLCIVLAPFAPFVTEELWQNLNNFPTFEPVNSVHLQAWPKADKKADINKPKTLPIQINGKVRMQIEITGTPTENQLLEALQNNEKFLEITKRAPVKKLVFVKDKIISVVI